MENQNEQDSGFKSKENPVKKHKTGSRLLIILTIILGLGLVGGGVWFYQQRKIDSLNKDLSASNSEKNKIDNELLALKLENAKAKTKQINVLYGESIIDTDPRYGSTGGQPNGKAAIVIVKFSATNNGTGTTEINASDFSLKKVGGDVLTNYADSTSAQEAVKSFGLPDSLTPFTSYNLKPGEKIDGALVFWSADKNAYTLEMSYGSQEPPIGMIIEKTTKVCTREGTTCE